MSLWAKCLFVLAAGLLVLGLSMVVDRMLFLSRAQTTVGHVIGVSAENARCGGRRSRYACTRFRAAVEYRINGGAPRRKTFSAGRKRGYDQPVSYARHPPGSTVRLLYDPRNTQRVYRDTKSDVFGGPLLTLFLSLGAGAGGLNQRNKT
jgi:hypothetical protein